MNVMMLSFLELDEINSPDPTEQKDGETENKVDDQFEQVKFMTMPISIEVKNLYASWTESSEENMTLQNINFSVNGDAPFLAVVGHVGSGKDLEKLPNRDLTIIGERGVTLSGGQKARVSLARAIYSDSDVYLLDDPLSAVDSVVAKYIFESCIRDLLKDRLVLLVTHQLQFAEQANHIMVINEGKMVDYGNITYLRVNDFNPSKVLEIKKSEQLLRMIAVLYIHRQAEQYQIGGLLTASILDFPIRFFDINPIGRILNRLSKDVFTLDDLLPTVVIEFLLVTLRFTAILLTNTIANAGIVIPTCLFMATILILKLYYMKTSREIKRLEAIALDPGLVGLSLMYTTSMCTSFQYAMLLSTELENTMVSAERLLQYTQLETETSLDSHSDKNPPPPGWPQRGAIVFDKASFRYSVDTPVVLKLLSFTIQPGEKDPVLFCASLRYNIDPFEEYNDSDLWSALEQASDQHIKYPHQQVQLKSAVEKLEGRLQFKVSEWGWNFSTGQRQLLCLKILRETFSQCTVLTVAHRLNTIIDSDRIMVMDGGEVVDFDDPYTLLQDENSQLKIMVDKTGPSSSKQLHQVAEAAYHSRKQRHDI
eukprot:Em0009g880a